MLSEKGQFLYFFLILCHESPVPKLTNFCIFITHVPLCMTLFSKSPCRTVHIKVIFESGCTEGFSEKTHILRAITKFRIELSVALVSGLKLLSNFTKNTIFGVREVLDLPLEYYNRF